MWGSTTRRRSTKIFQMSLRTMRLRGILIRFRSARCSRICSSCSRGIILYSISIQNKKAPPRRKSKALKRSCPKRSTRILTSKRKSTTRGSCNRCTRWTRCTRWMGTWGGNSSMAETALNWGSFKITAMTTSKCMTLMPMNSHRVACIIRIMRKTITMATRKWVIYPSSRRLIYRKSLSGSRR